MKILFVNLKLKFSNEVRNRKQRILLEKRQLKTYCTSHKQILDSNIKKDIPSKCPFEEIIIIIPKQEECGSYYT